MIKQYSSKSQPAPAGTGLAPDLERELLRAYIDSANDGIFVICDEMKFHVANTLMTDWLGLTERELTAHCARIPITEFFGQQELEAEFLRQFTKVLHGQAARFQGYMHPPKGSPRWVEISMNRVALEAGELVIGIARDISEHKRLTGALQHFSSHDDLTGLANRREFHRRLVDLVELARSGQGEHALIYLDLDQFKIVNDTCGHMAGDELLRELGGRLLPLVKNDDLIARLGGDEFGVLLQNTPIDQAERIAEAIRAAIAGHSFVWEGRRFELTTSLGLCAITRRTETPETALSNADAACYVAKDNGRNRAQLYFGGEACAGKQREMQWVTDLRRALDENRFQIWYQEILGLSVAAKGARNIEVLLRLVDDDGSVVAPGCFFPAAERYGLMPAIDRWVIEHVLLSEVCSSLHRGLANGDILRCAINLSGASLNDERFLGFIEDVLTRTQVPGDAICFEITETVAIANLQRACEVMARLRRFGCHFALDDFGSGMSSFGYLKNLPVDFLKIDGALVKNIVDDAADHAMVEAMQKVASVLNIQTVAEFVESEAALRVLHAIGIDYAQGYAIHRPEPLSR